MPELPEVETVRLGIAPALEGRTITHAETRRGDLRRPFPRDFAARLKGRKVERLRRRAKYILADLDNGETLVIHLGMSGRMTVQAEGRTAKKIGTLIRISSELEEDAVVEVTDYVANEIALAFEVFSRQFANCAFVQSSQRVCFAIVKEKSGELRVGVAGDVARAKQLIAQQSGFSRLDQCVPGIMSVGSAAHRVAQ